MLPGPLVSVYQQYKQDTNAVASWLASTAKSCGYPADLLSGGSSQALTPETSKRLKGKARKQAKAAAPQSQGSSSRPARPDYTIAIKDFIPLAECVAASKKPVVVPLAFAHTLNRVISTRSAFGGRLADLGSAPSDDANSKHSYFVGVLEQVRQVLKPRVPPAFQDAANPRNPSDTLDEVGGRFAGLSVYEPSEEFLNAPDIKRPVPVKDDNATYVVEPIQDMEEALFAYALMIDDLTKIRARIGWIWANYRDGLSEPASAAVATNTACDLARNLMEDMAPIFKAHGGPVEIASKFYLCQCLDNGFFLDEITDPANEFNYGTYDIANDTYMIPFIMITSFLTVLDPKDLRLYKEGTFGTYDPTRDWDSMTNQEKFKQDKVLMMEVFGELVTVARCIPNYPVCDEFIRGMQELDRTREIPMYLAFTAQVFLDIHHVLREKVYSAHEKCMSNIRIMDEDLRLHLDFHTKLRIKHWPASNDEMIRQLREKIKWVQEDPVHNVKAKVFGQSAITAPAHRILKYSPVLSGLILYHFRAQTYDLGLTVANAWGSVAYSLHLYNALQQERLLSPPGSSAETWEDMDLALTILNEGSFFVGAELPKNPQDYFKKFCLQMGTTASAFMKIKHKRMRNLEDLHSKKGPRGIKEDCAPVSGMFVDRYVHNTGQVDWTPEHVDQIVSCSLFEEEGKDEDGKVLLGQIDDPEKLRERKRNIAAGRVGKKTTAAGARMPPDRLIRALTLALHAESITLAFPYLTLHRTSWRMLRALREGCEPLLLRRYGPEYMERESQLPWLVGWTFMALAEGDTGIFVKAADTLKEQ
ncbi:hypothetical protein KVR01_012983 [Diaporthe batatas]|uniref:uncharacterized protein n=1 Tax=Diaporthe batatas TaxID=748121 RepID=UPI001D043A21|nr:uncharacterized protein KVR01_012983 [Diaporthe batatas]KAG8157275.1 hypothetical protein KVR01_012983 [Diaporthe batatas]